ncbi:MAG: FkbM family methyltransferase [Saprospiraceae bacterium]
MSKAEKSIEEVDRLGKVSKFTRMLHHPLKYFTALGYRILIYPIVKKPLYKKAALFFGETMEVALPAGTDIFISGGKSHDSEIRLAKFFINTLKAGDAVVDVGAHFGYFTRLANKLVGLSGVVCAFEPSPDTFQVLNRNCKDFKNILTFPLIVSEVVGAKSFVSFDSLHSEYASTSIEQYEAQSWYAAAKPTITQTESTSLDYFLEGKQLFPRLIKIDAEGGEWSVLKGAEKHLEIAEPIVIMEYLTNKTNGAYQKCIDYMLSKQYAVYLIDKSGLPVQCTNVEQTLAIKGVESDNVVFLKAKK